MGCVKAVSMVLIEGMCRDDDVNLSAGWGHQGRQEIAGQENMR